MPFRRAFAAGIVPLADPKETPRCHRGCDRLPPPIELARANGAAHKVSRKTRFLTVRVRAIPIHCENGFTTSPKPAHAVLGVSRNSLNKTRLFSSPSQNHGGQAVSRRQRHDFCSVFLADRSPGVDRPIFSGLLERQDVLIGVDRVHNLGRVSFVWELCRGGLRLNFGVISLGHRCDYYFSAKPGFPFRCLRQK